MYPLEDEVFEGTTGICLTSGMMDYEAHDIIEEGLKKINPKVMVNTKWVDLEDLPFEEYGDDFED